MRGAWGVLALLILALSLLKLAASINVRVYDVSKTFLSKKKKTKVRQCIAKHP